MKFQRKLAAISLGQGQGPRAEAMMRSAMDRGHWVFFQNCHLSPSWMPSLERLIEQIDPTAVSQQSNRSKHTTYINCTHYYIYCWSWLILYCILNYHCYVCTCHCFLFFRYIETSVSGSPVCLVQSSLYQCYKMVVK